MGPRGTLNEVVEGAAAFSAHFEPFTTNHDLEPSVLLTLHTFIFNGRHSVNSRVAFHLSKMALASGHRQYLPGEDCGRRRARNKRDWNLLRITAGVVVKYVVKKPMPDSLKGLTGPSDWLIGQTKDGEHTRKDGKATAKEIE